MIEVDYIVRCLAAVVQAVLSGDAVAEDEVFRLPLTVLDDNEGQAVKVDMESEPGIVIFSLVPTDV